MCNEAPYNDPPWVEANRKLLVQIREAGHAAQHRESERLAQFLADWIDRGMPPITGDDVFPDGEPFEVNAKRFMLSFGVLPKESLKRAGL
jgi:hypothetical protein